ncbi:methyl-accepting chemotaxis protein [Paenibacillus agricola]|uniref:Cyclic nucleotide-binding domain-containing protein n=1 Tax=Paenibacillus agricola TaxID=2716264 RepID=A0ABX0J9Z5_9BACL|nr:methyl-accepting chemotaxis protein [Paenibacillus agricola]NHN30570.1 cyclic nucleotide-binding domain-containing protein [Paenibacillus agricola]
MNEQLLKDAGQVLTKEVGEVIFRSGDPGEDMYVVLSGTVDIFLEQNGSSIPVAKLKNGDFFGEMSLLEGMPRSGTAKVSQKSELVLLSEPAFHKLMSEDSALAWRVMKGLSTRIRSINNELVQRIGNDLQEVSKLLHDNAEVLSISVTQIDASAQEIDTNERQLAQQIKEVQVISKDIGVMLAFIRNVATQTHILGLNAAIEAARSGEHGRGFGVIAEEIRKLSSQSKDNAEKIADLTEQIVINMDKITASSENSAHRINEQSVETNQMVASVDTMAGLAKRLSAIASTLT